MERLEALSRYDILDTPPEPDYDELAALATYICQVPFGAVTLIDATRQWFKATSGPKFTEVPRELSICSDTILQNDLRMIPDLSEGPQYRDHPNVAGEPGFRFYASSPLLTPDGQAIGTLCAFDFKPKVLTSEQQRALQSLSHQVVKQLELRRHAKALGDLNQTLEQRVRAQVEELSRLGRLRRFLSPQLAEMIASSGDERLLESHRRDITVVFCDLRGFTAFAETAEPEEVMTILREYHAALGELISQYEGTLERFAGDGIMVFFNDPVPCDDAALRAVRMAVGMRERMRAMLLRWRRRGYELGFGVGIAKGYATCGRIGFEGRYDYGAIGTVTNLAARLCNEAEGDQILVSGRVFLDAEEHIEAAEGGALTLKGLNRPVTVYQVTALR